jgi:hypothetical protein
MIHVHSGKREVIKRSDCGVVPGPLSRSSPQSCCGCGDTDWGLILVARSAGDPDDDRSATIGDRPLGAGAIEGFRGMAA